MPTEITMTHAVTGSPKRVYAAWTDAALPATR